MSTNSSAKPITINKTTTTKSQPSKIDEAELDRLAEEELLKEAKTLSRIADVEGALGWKKRRVMRTNKFFLHQTLRQTVNFNKRKNAVKP